MIQCGPLKLQIEVKSPNFEFMVLEWIRSVHMIQCSPLKVADRSKSPNFVLSPSPGLQ
jgi:hypothetical protein